VVDRSAERLASLSAQFPEAYLAQNFDDVLVDANVEAVIVAVPPQSHAEVAVAAFDAGKHVYLEKPIAANRDDARCILKAWRRSGRIGMIGYNFRFSPVVRAAAARIRSGELGEILAVQASFQLVGGEHLASWRSCPGSGGDAMLDIASHHIDLLASLLPTRVKSVSAILAHKRTQDDCVSIAIAMEDGCVCQLFASSAAGTNANRLHFYGTRGSLKVDLLDNRLPRTEEIAGRLARVKRIRDRLSALNFSSLLRSPGYEPSFSLAIEAFLSAISRGTQERPDLTDGYNALVICEAARHSAMHNTGSVGLDALAPESIADR
jgi:predicted dehydrogenase